MKKISLSSFTEEQALQIMADNLERLFVNGVNNIRLVTNEDEVLIVHIHSEGKLEEAEPDETEEVVS